MDEGIELGGHMDVTYSLRLSDGTVIDGLSRYAAYYVSGSELNSTDFEGKTDEVAITWHYDGDSGTEVYANMEVTDLHEKGGKWYFLLDGLTAEEIRRRETDAQLALVSDGLLEVADLAAANEAELDDVITALMELADIIGGGE